MKQYHIKLPWPPQTNHLYTIARGRKVKGTKGRKFNDAVISQTIKANQQYNLSGKLKIKIIANPPDRKNVT